MNKAIELMLSKYKLQSLEEHDQALREIFQEIALLGLWRGKFFEHAAFYGGTALRIFYNLDRFSEDLDFTLLTPNPKWSWKSYGEAVKSELSSYGFDVTFKEQDKKTQTPIKSAFLKTPTVQEMLKIGVHSDLLKGVHRETMIRIKVEIDTDPPSGYEYEQKFLSEPVPVSIRCVSEESLFACKMHAAFFRVWKDRVKGRDWYDMVWFIRRKVPLSLALFSQLNGRKKTMTQEEFITIAKERIESLNVKSAIQDIIHYISDKNTIPQTWSKEFFNYWIDQIKFKK